MPDPLPILVAGADPHLRAEFADALAGAEPDGVLPHFVAGHAAAVESARAVHPRLAVVDCGADLKTLRHLVEELHAAAPGVAVAAAFRPELFGGDTTESTFFIEATRAGVRDFLRRPLSSADLGQLIGRVRRPAAGAGKVPGRVVTVVSNKGGVGKSTLAVSLACALARRHPDRVLLIDASLQMGVCAPLLDLRPETTLTDAVRERDRLDETLLRELAVRHDCGLHLLACPADAEEASAVDDGVVSRVVTLARRGYDFVIVDTFPMLDRVVLAALDQSDRVLIVVENVVPTVLGAVHLLKLFDRIGLPAARQRVVLSRYQSGASAPSPADVAARLGRAIDVVVPHSRKVVAAANLGTPYVLKATTLWGFGKAIRRVVEDVESIRPAAAPARRLADKLPNVRESAE